MLKYFDVVLLGRREISEAVTKHHEHRLSQSHSRILILVPVAKTLFPVDRWSWELLKPSKTFNSKESATHPLSGLFLFSLFSVVYPSNLPGAVCSAWFVSL